MKANWIDLLPTAAQNAIIGEMTPRAFKRGTLIYARSEAPDGLYLIRSGSAYSTLNSPHGNKLLLRIMRQSDLFGETVALDLRPAPVFVEARTRLETSFVPSRRIAAVARAFPAIERALALVASNNLRAALSALEELVLLPLQQRLQSRLASLAREAIRSGAERDCVIEITQSELAAMMGASRQAVNAALRDLELRRLIECQFRRIVCRAGMTARR
jgi:CRP-like cAMP-binding protein